MDIHEVPTVDYSEGKTSVPSISIDKPDIASTRRAMYGRSKTTNTIVLPDINPVLASSVQSDTSPCSMYMVNEFQQSSQELSSPCSSQRSTYIPGAKGYPDMTNPSRNDVVIRTSHASHLDDPRQRLLLRKQVSEDVYRSKLSRKLKKVQHNSSAGLSRYLSPNRSFQESNSEIGGSTANDLRRYLILQLYMCLQGSPHFTYFKYTF